MANEFIIRKGFKSQEDSQITGSISLSGSFKDQESSSGTAGQVLSSTVSGSQWVDAADSSAITGAGTTGTITKWTTGGSVIGDSVIVESAGNVGIGVTPSAWRDSVAVNSVIQGADNYAILNRNDGGTKTNYFAQNFYYNASDVGTRMDTGKWSLFYSQNQEDGSHGFYTSTNDTGPSPSMQSKLIIGSTGAATFKATTPSPVVSTPIVSIADSVNGVLGGIGALASGGYPLQIWGGTLEFKTGSSSNIATATTKLTITSTGLTQINSTSTTALELITNQSASSLRLKNTGSVVADWIMQSGGITVGDLAFYNLDTSAYKLTITSGGDATFSGNVTAVQGIFKNSGVPAILAYRDLDVTVVGTAGQGIEFGAKSGATFVSGAAIYGTLDNPATNGSLQFQTLTAGTLSNKLTISSGGDATFSGNVLIGTNINSDIPLQVNKETAGSGTAIAFLKNTDAAGNGLVVDVTTPQNYVADFRIGNISKMRISSGGNVGIGTTTLDAYANLTVFGNYHTDFIRDYHGGDRAYVLRFGANTASSGYVIGSQIAASLASDDVNGSLEFYTKNAGNLENQLTISSGGLATFSNGIKFGGTPSPAYDIGADTLDAYEEGSWTPTLLNANGNESTEGMYTRIGNTVRVGGLIIFGSQSNTTQFTIQSFPFQVGTTNEGTRGGVSVGYSTSSTYYTILMDNGYTQARVWGQGATGNPTLASLSGTRVYFGGTYQV